MKATTNRKVYLRSAPGNLFYPVRCIPGGAPLTVLGKEGEWLVVSVDDRKGTFTETVSNRQIRRATGIMISPRGCTTSRWES